MAEYKRLNLLLIEGVTLVEATKKVTLPTDVPAIGSLEDIKQYLQGTNGIAEVTSLSVSTDGKEITVLAEPYPYNENVLRLTYTPVPKTGEIVRA